MGRKRIVTISAALLTAAVVLVIVGVIYFHAPTEKNIGPGVSVTPHAEISSPQDSSPVQGSGDEDSPHVDKDLKEGDLGSSAPPDNEVAVQHPSPSSEDEE